MAEPLSDFSKILELQEVKKHYDDLQERHSAELTERDNEITQLRSKLAELQNAQSGSADPTPTRFAQETERLNKQLTVVRQEYEAKIERLNARVRELSASGGERQPVAAATAEKKGFFRR